MIKLKIKFQYLTTLIFSILTLIALVQTISIAGAVITANSNQTLKASLMELPSDGLDLVAFNPDGNTLASVDSGGQIMLWDLASGQVRVTLPNQLKSLVSGIVFSPDSNTLASVSDNSIRLWDAASGDVRLTLPVSVLVTDPVFSPDGRTLAAVALDTSVTLWNLQSGSATQILTSHQSGVNAIAFSPDGKTLVTGGQDGQIKIWNAATGTEQLNLPGESGAAVTDLVFSSDGRTLAASDQDARIMLWDSQSGSTTQILTGHQSGINTLAFSPDSKILATGGQDAQIKLWDKATGLEQASLPGEGGVADLVFNPDGKSLASVGKTGQVIVWDLMTGLEQLTFQAPISGAVSVSPQEPASANSITKTSIAAKAVSVSPDGNGQTVNRAAVSQDTERADKKKSSHDWKGVTALAVSPDGTLYGGATRDGEVRLWTSTGKERFAVSEHHGAVVTGVVFSADGKLLVSVARDTEIQIRNIANGQKVRTLSAHEHPIRTVAASPDGKFLASGGEETRIMLWDLQAGKLIRILSGHTDFINAVSFSPSGKHLASAGADGRILLWDVETGQLVQTLLGHSDEVNTVAFSPDGKFLASGSADSQVILWDAATGQQIQSFTGHQAAVRAVAFSPNGQKLVSTGEDTKILVWDTAARKLDKQIAGATNAINALAFNPLGNLIAGSEDGAIKEWDVDKGQTNQIISVPIQPQSDNSETISTVSVSSIESVPAVAGQLTQPIATKGAALTPANIFNRFLNWLIPAAEAAIPNPPGGPILVVTTTSDSFGKYYAEILRTEGFNEFTMADISTVNATNLADYDVVILAKMTLTPAQVTLFTNWVNAGGNLIAMRPDAQLAGLLGVSAGGTPLSNGYLLVDTSQAPGNGIVNQTLQFHGAADRYTLTTASSLATLYTNATTATANPAVTLRSVDANGGQAAAFTYDLATSIVYTRQGNPAWATQERDGFSPIRSDDKFFGDATGDPQADWIDFNKIAIPQADEQQRLLVNLILEMNRDKKPLPRFWYFPRGEKAVVIMTGDDHGNNGTQGRFDQFKSMSPAGCSVANWECVRGTSYIYPDTPLTNAQAAAYNADGFEVGLHVNTNCADFTPASLRTFYSQQIDAFRTKYSSIPAPITQRHHCIAWTDWVTGAIVQLENAIRFDTSYYFWPPGWVQNRPGFFSGSGMPMRFVNLDGSIIDVYHAASQMTDESGQTYPFTIDTLLDRALGAEGYYGAYTINAHTDVSEIPESTTTVNSALARSVPIVSSKQMLNWLDGRNSSSFGSLAWNNNSLSFTVTAGAGANGLQAMLPLNSATGVLVGLTGPNGAVAYTTEIIKGIPYAFFTAAAGTYTAAYGADTTPPTVTSNSPASGATGVIQQPTVTATFSEPIDPATVTTFNFQLQAGTNPPVSATVSYDAGTRTARLTPGTLLAGSTLYTAKILTGIKDSAGNALAAPYTWSFTTQAQPCVSTPCNAWNSSTTPGTPSENDPNSVELGVKFRSDLNGSITGIRFYQVNTGTYAATLWSSTGQQLATTSFTATAPGWQQANFSAPVAITANTVYVASYHAPNGNYAADNQYFANTGVDNVPIHLLQNGVSGGNGVYAYSAGSTFPTNTYQSSNYWVDVVFTTGSGTTPDTTPPTVTAQSPVSGASGVATSTTVTATFSEAMDAATITASTFELRNASNSLVSATVSYNATSRTATLTPGSALTAGAAYTATVKGGATDPRVKDSAGNALAANATWSFTTAAGAGCSGGTTSIWPTNPTPSIISDSDTSAVELGVKFRSSVNGFICGIRFYKGSLNTGSHVGTLWSSTGQQLAQVTFTNETASGWQQMSFAAPVAITANTVYVASYRAPAGRYSANGNYFTSGVTSGSLYALSNSESGGNGVYLYGSGGFPTNTYQSSNYWVDVVFTSDTGPDTTAPTLASTSPAAGATGVNPATAVTATFNEAMKPETITTSTFQLQSGSNPPVSATVTYAGNTATLTPSNALATNTPYTATVKGGAGGVQDSAGNALATDFTWSFTTGVDPCTTGGNPIECENAKPGNPSSEWDISGAGDASIQGFATDISVNRGETVSFKIDTPSTDYRLDIYRMGYYGGNGARKIATIQPSAGLPQNQPNCLTNTTGLIDCGNWSASASWAVPADATSGIYFAKAVREDGANAGRASHIVFVVRDDAGSSDILFQTSDTTWQAYNNYGGNSLYQGTGPGTGGNSAGRAYKVSYNRPFNTRAVDNGQDWLFNAEYPMVRWLEANGYKVSYFTGVDSDRRGNLIGNHKLFLSVGHDEYWSGAQRANIETARNVQGVHLAFFSGNEVFWKTRWENSIDSSNTANRTLVCYKETHNFPNNTDPTNIWTGTWRDPRGNELTPPKTDGGRPENALLGPIFTVNDGATTSITVPDTDGKMRLWRNTSIATLAAGTSATLAGSTLGYEWDEDLDNGFRPAGLVRNSTTIVNNAPILTDYGSTFGSGIANHALTLYRSAGGALVFGAGTVQWPWGLDSNHDRGSNPPDLRMQQATVNLFADMGAQPATLQPGLVAVTASTDVTAPTSAITAPANGATISSGSQVSITGTATDTGGGVVGGVEVSVDGGSTWHPANGRANWSYTWTANSSGSVTIKSRAVDDSGNLGTPNAGVSVTVGGVASCTSSNCTIWPSTTVPGVIDGGPDSAVELGVKFRADVNGTITGIRFYKAGTNTGTHVGNLWSSTGTLLASATFSSETASGWQQVNFTTPVSITANTVYVASYHTNVGHYSVNQNGFATTGVDNPPLHALANGVSGGNGVYAYGAASAFPSQTWNTSNYWVDVVFSSGPAPTLASIAVTPANPTILTGATQQFTATGTYSDNSTQNLTSQVTWVSSSTAVATINAGGLATGVSAGSTNISATSGSVSGNTTLTVNAAPLSITTTSLPNGTLNTAYPATTLTASGGTPPYTSWSIAGGTLPTGLSLNPSTGAITGTPTAAGIFNFTAQVSDSASPVGTASKALSITVAAQATTIWPSTAVPGLADSGPDSAVELGVKFRADVNGAITGIRFYKGSGNTGTHVGNLWSSTGTLLASATFSNETASGWQQVNFTTPVSITANTVYVASYHTNVGHYSVDQNGFATTGVDNPPLHALANGVSGGNGVYAYGAGSAFPSQTWNASNYWVDVAFTTP